MKACTIFTFDEKVGKEWMGKFESREPLTIFGQKYIIGEFSTNYEHGFWGVTIKMYPVFQVKTTEIPNKQEAWDGEGLPPVGTVCDMHIDDFGWITGTVVVHIDLDEPTAVAHNGKEVFHGNASDFRPIKTDEQLAEEEIQAIRDEIRWQKPQLGPCPVARLYHKGYRKQ